MRTMTSCVKVPGHRTWDTSPLAQASWAVSFLPLNNISLAYSDTWERASMIDITLNSQDVDRVLKDQSKKDFFLEIYTKILFTDVLTDATPMMRGNVKEEQASGVWPKVV